MFTTTLNSKGLSLLAVLSLAGASTACSTVSPDEMDTGLQALRAEMMQEMQAGDASVSDQLGGRIAAVERRMAAMESDLQQMEQDFEVSIARLEDQLRFNVPVYFAFDDATVEAEDEAVLNRFGSVAREYYPDALITVEGFTDPSGSADYNLQLGQRRAAAVAAYLLGSSELSDERVRAVSYGEDTRRLVMPQGWGPGAPGWENRRVVLVIDHDGEPPVLRAPIS
ncbi:MAG: OmpA family protein [Gemmatimonadota bacterium]|nr:OmpA family protein [Gemmatimonadota bacterium]MDH3422011.1 OmpA family protein [Gemmatimonadota bacterium]